MSTAAESTPARMEISSPRRFTGTAVLLISAYGLLLMLPVLLTMLAVSVMKYGLHTYLLPLGMLLAATYFLPFGFGNSYVSRLARSLGGPGQKETGHFVVQLTLQPRLRSGLRSLLEDADDVGYLRITGSGLVFEGDSIKLSLPREQIQQVQRVSIGWRGFFISGHRTRLVVSGLPGVTSLEFAERSSCTLLAARRTAGDLYQQLA